MASLMFTLETGKSTLLNTQVAIQTTSHNIANADSTTYARQKAVSQTNIAYRAGSSWIGMGAHVEQVVQLRDMFIDRQMLTSASKESHYSTLSSHLTTLGAYMADDGETGLSGVVSNFWGSWETLQKNPMGATEREQVNESAQQVAGVLNDTAGNLSRISSDIDAELEMMAGATDEDSGPVETIMADIANLNRSIRLAENPRSQANDLRDQRFAALQELSQYLPIKYAEESNGAVTVKLVTGPNPEDEITLVANDDSAQISYSGEDSTLLVLSPEDLSWASVDLSDAVGGRVTGLLAAKGKALEMRDQLREFQDAFLSEVNSLETIFIEDPSTGEVQSSTDFWANYDPATSDSAIQDLSDLASKMIHLGDVEPSGLGGGTFSEYLAEMQRRLGTAQNTALSKEEFHGALKGELTRQQQSISGVSLDEEMVDMLKNQQVYQAAAKIIQMTNSLLQTVVDMV